MTWSLKSTVKNLLLSCVFKLKLGLNVEIFQCDTDDGISSDSESPTSIHSLVRQMQEKEKRILQLEAEVEKVSVSAIKPSRI